MNKFMLSLLTSLAIFGCRNDKPVDSDGDGYLNTEECDDTNPAISPKATDLVGDGFDQNCDGIDGTDNDGDGHASILSGGDDCDDESVDITVASSFYQDTDGDGFGNPDVALLSCSAPVDFVEDNNDCDDRNEHTHPEATEICDGADNDCDNLVDTDDDSVEGLLTVYSDTDGDGFGDATTETNACFTTETLVLDASDCNDSDNSIHPDAEELLGDGIDNNCDGQELCFDDFDADGFGSSHHILVAISAEQTDVCTVENNASTNQDDCDDVNTNTYPGANEVCDDIDNDCDGLIDDADASLDTSTGVSVYMDSDQDGFGDANAPVQVCEPMMYHSTIVGDCNDQAPASNPLATDIVGDGIDQNCDGADGLDSDGDGVASAASGGNDCDDTNSNILADTDSDGDGWNCATDCDDSNASIYPTARDTIGDGIDQDCNGFDAGQAPLFADITDPTDAELTAICSSYNVMYGDLTIDMNNIGFNSTAELSCLTAIYGALSITNINSASVISFENLQLVQDLTLVGGVEYDFPALVSTSNISISYNLSSEFDGNTSFPVLEDIEDTFSWTTNMSQTLQGFDLVDNLGTLHIYSDTVLEDVQGFSNVTDMERVFINNTNLVHLSNPTLESVQNITITNNDSLVDTEGLQNVSSTMVLNIYNNDSLIEDGCMYYTPDTNLTTSTVTYNGFDVGDCDLDADGYTLNDGDCDDQDSTLSLVDQDSDGYSTCDDDCNDANNSIHPNATEIWYDGVDQDCDNRDDFDQDGDTDKPSAYGGNDCDDQDMSLNSLDIDQDGTSTCDGDTNEPIESCLEWLEIGASVDGIYPLLLSNGNSFDVYCDMNTNGGGWTLYAVTKASRCAEDLRFGNSELLDDSTAYLSMLTQSHPHTEFMQDVRTNGVSTDYTIHWTFIDGSDTLENRFFEAGDVGVSVQWDVNYQYQTYSYSGIWMFSDGAFSGGFGDPWNQGSGTSFSDDDGAWAARTGLVNGNSSNYPTWGHGNFNSDDSTCSSVYFNGTAYSSPNLINRMYFR